MSFERGLYNILLPAAAVWARISAKFNAKIAEGIEGRRGLRERWGRSASSLDPEVVRSGDKIIANHEKEARE